MIEEEEGYEREGVLVGLVEGGQELLNNTGSGQVLVSIVLKDIRQGSNGVGHNLK